MGDSPPDHYSPDFSFNPTPQGMSPDQLFGFFSSMTEEQRQMAATYWSSQPGTSVNPSGTTTAVPTPPEITPIPTPQSSVPPSPVDARSSSRRRRRSRGSSSGGGCCGSGGTDASTPPRERPPLSSVDSTPLGSPSTPWGPHDHDAGKLYKCKDGAPVMNSVGKLMKTRLRQLCTIQFGHEVMTIWDDLDQEKKNYINRMIHQEFRPLDPRYEVSNDWIQLSCRLLMGHRRSDARDAFKDGKPKPVWLDDEEWEGIRREHTENPNRFAQQRAAARIRLQTAGTSHLGSGGLETMRAEFVSIMFKFVYLSVCLWRMCS